MGTFEFAVSLRTFSFNVDPAEIVSRLGIEPKWLRRIGEPRADPTGRLLGGTYDCSYCSFPIPRQHDEDLASLLDRTMDSLAIHEDLFLRIKIGGGRSEFFVGWYSTGNTGDTFGAALLKHMGDMHIDLALDIYGESDAQAGQTGK